jgi:hypothetical protein
MPQRLSSLVVHAARVATSLVCHLRMHQSLLAPGQPHMIAAGGSMHLKGAPVALHAALFFNDCYGCSKA